MMLFVGCASKDIGENHFQEGNVLDTKLMLWYDIENDKDFFSEGNVRELLAKREIEAVRYYNENNVEVILYTDEKESDSYIMINGQEHPFSFPGYYSVRDWTCPEVCIYDINNDSIPDVFVSDYYGDMNGMAQDAYLSDGNGNYKELGSVSWNMFYSYEKFPYEVILLDNFEAKIELEEFQISEVIELDKAFAEVAVDLGIYDKWGKITDYGLQWQSGTEISGYQSPYEKEISYIVNSEDIFVIRVISQIAAGYSDYNLGGGFVFEWIIQDEKYQLLNIDFMK